MATTVKAQSDFDTSVARELIAHENELINHRLTWFITLQGLLMAALGFAWDKTDARGLVFVFCGLGILSAISTATILWGGAAAIERLSMIEELHKGCMVIGRRATLFEKIFYPWFAMPVLFAVAWALICWLNWVRHS